MEEPRGPARWRGGQGLLYISLPVFIFPEPGRPWSARPSYSGRVAWALPSPPLCLPRPLPSPDPPLPVLVASPTSDPPLTPSLPPQPPPLPLVDTVQTVVIQGRAMTCLAWRDRDQTSHGQTSQERASYYFQTRCEIKSDFNVRNAYPMR